LDPGTLSADSQTDERFGKFDDGMVEKKAEALRALI